MTDRLMDYNASVSGSVFPERCLRSVFEIVI